MKDLDDAGLTDVLGSLRYKSPSLEHNSGGGLFLLRLLQKTSYGEIKG